MNNSDRNTRTLIVSFLIAIFALIPLRFVEVGTQQSLISNTQVLGETISVSVEAKSDDNEVGKKLEAPYDEIDQLKGDEPCLSKETIDEVEKEVNSQLEKGGLSEEQVNLMIEELGKIETNVCKN